MTDRHVPLLQQNADTVQAVAHILHLGNPDRLVAVDIHFGNGLSTHGAAASATIELLLDADQLRRLTTTATNHNLEYPT